MQYWDALNVEAGERLLYHGQLYEVTDWEWDPDDMWSPHMELTSESGNETKQRVSFVDLKRPKKQKEEVADGLCQGD